MKKSRWIDFFRILAHVLLLRPWVKLFMGFHVRGRENLSGLDRFILVANHNSHLDILLLFSLLAPREIGRTHAVAEKTYFSKSRWVFRLVEFLFQPIWVTRGEPDLEGGPLARLEAALEEGHNLVLFPEGTRGAPGEMGRFKSGLGRLAERFRHLPLVPVFLAGPERALPKATFLPLPICNRIVVGPPQRSTGTHRDITRSLESILKELARSASVGRHQRETGAAKPMKSIAFLGIDGSGKSTLSRITAKDLSEPEGLSTCLISDLFTCFEGGELKEVQPLLTEKLRRFISHHAKRAGSLKGYKVPKMAELLLRNHLHHEAARWYAPDYIVLDGSPLLNMLAWAVLYKGDRMDEAACAKALAILTDQGRVPGKSDPIFKELPELALLNRLPLRKLILPEVVVFLDLSSEEAVARIESRGEPMQVHETREKLDRLRKAYLMVCKVVEQHFKVPVRILDGHASREEVARAGLDAVRTLVMEA